MVAMGNQPSDTSASRADREVGHADLLEDFSGAARLRARCAVCQRRGPRREKPDFWMLARSSKDSTAVAAASRGTCAGATARMIRGLAAYGSCVVGVGRPPSGGAKDPPASMVGPEGCRAQGSAAA